MDTGYKPDRRAARPGFPMTETPASLFDRLRRQPDARDWRRLVDLYTPVLHAWLRRHALQASDLDDLTQEILGVVVRELPDFRHNGRAGAFRAWLRAVAVHFLRRHWRARRYQAAAPRGGDFEDYLSQLEDPASGLSAEWDREHDLRVLHRLLDLIEPDFQPKRQEDRGDDFQRGRRLPGVRRGRWETPSRIRQGPRRRLGRVAHA
jgi:RNA polymerase sigma-70 factor, ECF subfamily